MGYISVITLLYTFTTFQEKCLNYLDNEPSSQPKIKRKNVNPYGEIITSDAVFEKVFENIQMQEQQRLKNAKRPNKWQKVETQFETDGETEEEEEEEE